MNDNATSGQEGSESVDEQRAQWEGANYGMMVCRNGVVNVENRNYNEPGHISSVEVADGRAVGCSCPHATHCGAHCKHQVAVEDRPLVVASATAAGATGAPVATNGGQPAAEIADTCEHDAGGCPGPHHLPADMCAGCLAESRVEFEAGVVTRGVGK